MENYPFPLQGQPWAKWWSVLSLYPQSLTRSSLASSPTHGLILIFHAHSLCSTPDLVVDSFLEGLPPAKDVVTSRCSHSDELRMCQAPSYTLTRSFLETVPSPRVDGNFKHYGRLGGAGIEGYFWIERFLGAFQITPERKEAAYYRFPTFHLKSIKQKKKKKSIKPDVFQNSEFGGC